jgi:(p)ppGpp synthase/HD superfamily hydrolase
MIRKSIHNICSIIRKEETNILNEVINYMNEYDIDFVSIEVELTAYTPNNLVLEITIEFNMDDDLNMLIGNIKDWKELEGFNYVFPSETLLKMWININPDLLIN